MRGFLTTTSTTSPPAGMSRTRCFTQACTRVEITPQSGHPSSRSTACTTTRRLALRHDYAQLRRATLGGFLAPAFRLLPAQSNDPRSASAGVEADRLPVVRKGIRMRTRLADDADEFRVDLGSVPVSPCGDVA